MNCLIVLLADSYCFPFYQWAIEYFLLANNKGRILEEILSSIEDVNPHIQTYVNTFVFTSLWFSWPRQECFVWYSDWKNPHALSWSFTCKLLLLQYKMLLKHKTLTCATSFNKWLGFLPAHQRLKEDCSLVPSEKAVRCAKGGRHCDVLQQRWIKNAINGSSKKRSSNTHFSLLLSSVAFHHLTSQDLLPLQKSTVTFSKHVVPWAQNLTQTRKLSLVPTCLSFVHFYF